MDKRSILAIALSLAVFLIWDYFFIPKQDPNMPPAQNPASQSAQVPGIPSSLSSPVKTEFVSLPKTAASKPDQTVVRTRIYSAIVSNRGGRIESLTYGQRNVQLVDDSVSGKKTGFDFPVNFSEREFSAGSSIQDAYWTMTRKNDRQIAFSIPASVGGNPVVIEKEFIFNDSDHYFDLVYRIKNMGRTPINFENSSAIFSPAEALGPKMDDYTTAYNALYSVYYADGSLEKGEKGGGMFSDETDTKTSKSKVSWFGINSRYFTLLMIPQGGDKATGVIYDSRTKGTTRIGGYMAMEPLAPNGSVERKFRVCIAEKESEILASVDPGIVEATDVSKWMEPLRNGILWCLIWINKLFGNFGLAIIVLSIITKGIFLPLTIKSTNSMKKMSELAPKMNELKEKYKDKPEKLQQATMEMYKKNGVNPMSGCLPILVQMPFFIALYSALSTSFALWGSPLGLWITDLSAPDSVWATNALGFAFSLNILPIVMTATTYVQQKMASMDNAATGAQAWMIKLMPILFIFMFWSMPSGLTLYWSVQNILQIAHQYYVNRIKKPKPVVE
ncbi:MAG: membrane protein insertase YidC [Spirochaetota bacterium]